MLNIQEIYDKTVNHMRAQGNPWGDYGQRGWNYINPDNPCQRRRPPVKVPEDIFLT